MVALGLLILVLAGLVGVITALANSGSDHTVTNFTVIGIDAAVSSGRVFIYGAIAGALAMLGLNMLLAGLGRGFKNKVHQHRDRKERSQLERDLEAERNRHAKSDDDIDLTTQRNVNVDDERPLRQR